MSLHDRMMNQEYPPTYPPPAYQQPISTPGYKDYPGHAPHQQQQPYPPQMQQGYQYGYPPPPPPQNQPQQQQNTGVSQGLLAGYMRCQFTILNLYVVEYVVRCCVAVALMLYSNAATVK